MYTFQPSRAHVNLWSHFLHLWDYYSHTFAAWALARARLSFAWHMPRLLSSEATLSEGVVLLRLCHSLVLSAPGLCHASFLLHVVTAEVHRTDLPLHMPCLLCPPRRVECWVNASIASVLLASHCVVEPLSYPWGAVHGVYEIADVMYLSQGKQLSRAAWELSRTVLLCLVCCSACLCDPDYMLRADSWADVSGPGLGRSLSGPLQCLSL
jgi:hypothetical protein